MQPTQHDSLKSKKLLVAFLVIAWLVSNRVSYAVGTCNDVRLTSPQGPVLKYPACVWAVASHVSEES